MKAQFGGKKLNIAFSFLAVIVMWAGWLIAYYTVRNDYVIPSFADTVAGIGKNLIDGQFWRAFGATLLRTLYSWAVAFALSLVCLSLSALSDKFRRFLAPFVSVLRTLPTMAITLMLLIWTSPKIAPTVVAFLMIFPLSYTQLCASFGGIDKKIIEMAEVYKVSRRDKLCKIYIPLMLPDIFAQTGANISLTLKVMISAEVLAGTFGSVGGLMYTASMYSRMDELFALTILMLVFGGLIEYALGNLTRITDVWVKGRGKTRKGGGA